MIEQTPERLLLIYDGDCGFCRRWVARLRKVTGERLSYEPSQSASPRFPQIPLENYHHSVQLVDPKGKVYQGAEAVYRGLSVVPILSWLVWMYRWIPGFAWVSEKVYRWVANNRHSLSGSCELGQTKKN
jgi:predicted DCC family thiol-disulfide oxidoreductase YuxK